MLVKEIPGVFSTETSLTILLDLLSLELSKSRVPKTSMYPPAVKFLMDAPSATVTTTSLLSSSPMRMTAVPSALTVTPVGMSRDSVTVMVPMTSISVAPSATAVFRVV